MVLPRWNDCTLKLELQQLLLHATLGHAQAVQDHQANR